jgi:cytotoxic regulatory T-cell molecule
MPSQALFFADADQLTKHRKIHFLLATPLKPIVEASVIRRLNGEDHVVLKCSTQRSKPPPQITWLLGNGLEISGKDCFTS